MSNANMFESSVFVDEKAETEKKLTEIRGLFTNTFLTGTYGFGYPKHDDIDIVVVGYMKDNVVKMIESLGYTCDTNNGSLGSVTVNNTPFNFICIHCDDRSSWWIATEIMRMLVPITNRNMRHGLFELIRGIVKAFELEPRG